MKLPSPFTKKQAQRNADSLSAAGVSLCLLFSLRNGEFCGKMTIIYLKVFLDTGRPHGVILLIHVLLDIGNRFITASSFFKMEERKFENGLILLFQTKLQRTIKGLQYTPYIIMGDVLMIGGSKLINSDLPITKSTEDTLNRCAFAKSLAKTILNYSFPSSFTIGLYGEWGSGKTSLLNMVFETIEDIDKDAVILRFNPWLCTDPKQLITQFFKQMATAIQLKKPTAEKAWELIDQYADIFDITSLIPGAGTFFSALSKSFYFSIFMYSFSF